MASNFQNLRNQNQPVCVLCNKTFRNIQAKRSHESTSKLHKANLESQNLITFRWERGNRYVKKYENSNIKKIEIKFYNLDISSFYC